jgi:hypothetical protein
LDPTDVERFVGNTHGTCCRSSVSAIHRLASWPSAGVAVAARQLHLYLVHGTDRSGEDYLLNSSQRREGLRREYVVTSVQVALVLKD